MTHTHTHARARAHTHTTHTRSFFLENRIWNFMQYRQTAWNVKTCFLGKSICRLLIILPRVLSTLRVCFQTNIQCRKESKIEFSNWKITIFSETILLFCFYNIVLVSVIWCILCGLKFILASWFCWHTLGQITAKTDVANMSVGDRGNK